MTAAFVYGEQFYSELNTMPGHLEANLPPSIGDVRRRNEEARRQQLAEQRRLLEAGATAEEIAAAGHASPAKAEKSQSKAQIRKAALKELGLYRKSVKERPVAIGYTPTRTFKPVKFPYQEGQKLGQLVRSVSDKWRRTLTSISSASVAGKKRLGSQGRNLMTVIEALRKHCWLQADKESRPVEVREQVFIQVDGERYSFAEEECGMSASTFHRALQHPLAHLFLRTQKVQAVDEESGKAQRNVGLIVSVALYEPELPADLEEACQEGKVDEGGVFVVQDFNCQLEPCKDSPLNSINKAACGKLTGQVIEGLSAASAAPGGWSDTQRVRRWLDAASLASKAGESQSARTLDSFDRERFRGAAAAAWEHNTVEWETACQLAIEFDREEAREVAAMGYFKALIHLGMDAVRETVQRTQRWINQQERKGKVIKTPGGLLMHYLNKKARATTGYNVRDLGMEVGNFTN
ncbi:hypothetical protein GCM10017783_22420 [Deinococcus piscis]|uniref:Uncharacterized protein n=1 Tax=Deinococcus piscis TaxID=394230 RepID=A0ABQ3K9G8_9DEIO|nr:hypothetical protein [Deinococcus piscis]GHG09395.1 hypothetical protein GCM10017783_22420 [Deinococcus piscis]